MAVSFLSLLSLDGVYLVGFSLELIFIFQLMHLSIQSFIHLFNHPYITYIIGSPLGIGLILQFNNSFIN